MWVNTAIRKAWVKGDLEAEYKLIEKKAWYYGSYLEEFLEYLLFVVYLCGG